MTGKTGGQKWVDMEDGVRGRRSKLLSNVTGITVYNHGLNCAMLDLLRPYQTLMCRLQTQSHPVAHRVCHWFHEFFDNTSIDFLGDDPLYGPHLNDWLNNTENAALKKEVKTMTSRFARCLLMSIKRRVQPYWGLLMACELANPLSPSRISPSAWSMVRDLCNRHGLSDHDINETVRQLKLQRHKHKRCSLSTEACINGNLLRFYGERLKTNKNHPFPMADQYARMVFCLYIASAVIETFFSKSKYTKNKYRGRLHDKSVSASLHLASVPKLKDEEVLIVDRAGLIDPYASWRPSETGKDQLIDSYVGKRVTKKFVYNDVGDKRPFLGTVRYVHWVQSEGHYCMHVDYDSESDSEDMDEWEIRSRLCGGGDSDSDSD